MSADRQDPHRRVAHIIIAAFAVVLLLLLAGLVVLEQGWFGH